MEGRRKGREESEEERIFLQKTEQIVAYIYI